MLDTLSATSIVQLVTVGGAAAVLFWVLHELILGRLHTSSEVDGLREDKEQLILINKAQADALKFSNETLARVIEKLQP